MPAVPLYCCTTGIQQPCILSPLVSAMILGDAPRLSFLVTRCVGSLNVSHRVCLSGWLPVGVSV